MVTSSKNAAEAQLKMKLVAAILMVVWVQTAFSSSSEAEYSPAADDNLMVSIMSSRKAMMNMPQPNCNDVGEYCDLKTWCCGQLGCKRNPGWTDYSGTCVDVPGCIPAGAKCAPPIVTEVCCYGYHCTGSSLAGVGTCVKDRSINEISSE